MKGIIFGVRVWPVKAKMEGDKVAIEVGQYSELTVLNLDSGDVELYNVETVVFNKWQMVSEDFARLTLDNPAKVMKFTTQTKFGKIKLVDCAETGEAVVLSQQD